MTNLQSPISNDFQWGPGWRDQAWSELSQPWDMIVIGGGITGAGVLREAARAGLRVLLVEAHDFASGTSSRSSKLVHGGFRYLKNAQVRLTLESVRERELLLRQGRGLVNPLPFLLANFAGDHTPAWLFGVGLTIYDLLALKWGHRHYAPDGVLGLCPQLASTNLLGGYRYFDASTDDARLVLRVIREAVLQGAMAINHARVGSLLQGRDGRVCGVALQDLDPDRGGRTAEATAQVVVSAAGVWADTLREHVGLPPRLRQLRGSHLVFAAARLPLARAVTFLHPQDMRPVFAVPWEGVTILGTTDVDHRAELLTDPSMSAQEAEYLLAAGHHAFPSLQLRLADVLASFSGIRAVVDTGKADPSKESREHVLWEEFGLLTVTGGKLTTFRRMAHSALRAVRACLPSHPRFDPRGRVLDPLPAESAVCGDLDASQRLRLLGRYGADACPLSENAGPGELLPIPGALALWAELRWAARAEGVVHLDDLLLRRVRLGLLLPRGGLDHLHRIRAIAQPELGWSDERWENEVVAYGKLWRRSYSLA
ncbi:MAG TPA: glycerol-3-phosphate dehydrogenase/oxidase [Anaerolineales bacterium]|nr:glycerol-3-phosphate dehydrogenase/oxidase [Anaerolineales bacterium]